MCVGATVHLWKSEDIGCPCSLSMCFRQNFFGCYVHRLAGQQVSRDSSVPSTELSLETLGLQMCALWLPLWDSREFTW